MGDIWGLASGMVMPDVSMSVSSPQASSSTPSDMDAGGEPHGQCGIGSSFLGRGLCSLEVLPGPSPGPETSAVLT